MKNSKRRTKSYQRPSIKNIAGKRKRRNKKKEQKKESGDQKEERESERVRPTYITELYKKAAFPSL